MIKQQLKSDQFAITLSTICVLHCFFAPSLLIISAGFLSFSVESELIHKLILLATFPISIFALFMGYKNHNNKSFIPIGIFGLGILLLAIILGESIFGDSGERGLTLIGSFLVAFSHFKNYKACKESSCNCHEL
jgi:hypothetical protein